MAKEANANELKEHDELLNQLVALLDGGQAHATFADAVKDFPASLRGTVPKGLPYSAWQLLEHMRIAQWDILEFSRNADHESPKWPEGYWPETAEPPDAKAWDHAVNGFLQDMKSMCALVEDDGTDLNARIPRGDGQNILREALLVADHNAYHLGQLVLVRRVLGAWTAD